VTKTCTVDGACGHPLASNVLSIFLRLTRRLCQRFCCFSHSLSWALMVKILFRMHFWKNFIIVIYLSKICCCSCVQKSSRGTQGGGNNTNRLVCRSCLYQLAKFFNLKWKKTTNKSPLLKWFRFKIKPTCFLLSCMRFFKWTDTASGLAKTSPSTARPYKRPV